MPNENQERIEALGPAERIIQVLTQATSHAVHGRPGMVTKDTQLHEKMRWDPVVCKEEKGVKKVFRQVKYGKKITNQLIGTLQKDGTIHGPNGKKVGEYRAPGLFPEVVAYFYNQIAEIWKMDNEFSAHLASWSWAQDHRDLKCLLAAFMLVQNRAGLPVKENDRVIFHDDDFRAVGEAMCLLRGKNDINPKLLLRVGQMLELPEVAKINHELGFGVSARKPTMGRYPKAVTKWLWHREQNIHILEGLVKAGYRRTVMALCRKVGYKPQTEKFFEILRWKQKQSEDGRRTLAIGKDVKPPEDWGKLSEKDICKEITKRKLGFKYVSGLIPKHIGLTRAIMAATIETGGLSDKDLVILTPTLEELGLLKVKQIEERWLQATTKAEDQRAANVAKNVKSEKIRKTLEKAADDATAMAMQEVTRGLRVWVIVDKSGSMQASIQNAKKYLAMMLQGFPADRLHVSVFNTIGTMLKLKSDTAAGINAAFRGHNAGGGTVHAAGIKALVYHQETHPAADEDLLVIFVGDQGEAYYKQTFEEAFQGLKPVAFGMLQVPGYAGNIVERSAVAMGIPCFAIEEGIFQDPYSVIRNLRNLIANTPVGKAAAQAHGRKSLVETILETKLLRKPVWA